MKNTNSREIKTDDHTHVNVSNFFFLPNCDVTASYFVRLVSLIMLSKLKTSQSICKI